MNTQAPTLEEVRAQMRREDQAARLGWTAAHADAVTWAVAGDLHHDAKGFYRTGRKGGRGRAVSRGRVNALIDAGFLHLDGTAVVATRDGREALTAWETVRPAPAVEEPKGALEPLFGGEEFTRRSDAWHAQFERHAREAYARLAATLARAEEPWAAEEQARREREAERAGRKPLADVWAEIHGPAPVYTYEDDGTVPTSTSVPDWAGDIAPAEQVPAVDRQAAPHIAPRRSARRLVVQHKPAGRRPTWPRPAHVAPAARRLDLTRHGRQRRSTLTADPQRCGPSGSARTLPHRPPRDIRSHL